MFLILQPVQIFSKTYVISTKIHFLGSETGLIFWRNVFSIKVVVFPLFLLSICNGVITFLELGKYSNNLRNPGISICDAY